MKKTYSKQQLQEIISQVAYGILNVVFAISVFLALVVFYSPILAAALLILSKWRVLAVKPRFWWANIQSNLVDLIVGLSYIVWLLNVPTSNWFSYIAVLLAYLVWLLLIKPRSSRKMVVAQGLIALFTGISSVLAISYEWHSAVVLLLEMLVCLATARHILLTYEVKSSNYYVILWTFVDLELLWLLNHWVVAYYLPLGGYYLIQPALVVTLVNTIICLVFDKALAPESELPKKFTLAEILLMTFSAITVFVLLVFLIKPMIGGI